MKKGFTLIEVLAVIVILAIVSLTIFPEVNRIIKNSKQKSYDTQIKNLIEATKKLVEKDTSLLPESEYDISTCITLTQLKEAGEIPTDIITDPRNTSNRIDGIILISYVENGSYTYSYRDACPN